MFVLTEGERPFALRHRQSTRRENAPKCHGHTTYPQCIKGAVAAGENKEARHGLSRSGWEWISTIRAETVLHLSK